MLTAQGQSPGFGTLIWLTAPTHVSISLSLRTTLPPSPSRGSKPILEPSLQIRSSSFRDACSSLAGLDLWAYRGGEGAGEAEKSSEPEADKGSHSSVPEGQGTNPLREIQKEQNPRKRGTEAQREEDRDQGEGNVGGSETQREGE